MPYFEYLQVSTHFFILIWTLHNIILTLYPQDLTTKGKYLEIAFLGFGRACHLDINFIYIEFDAIA